MSTARTRLLSGSHTSSRLGEATSRQGSTADPKSAAVPTASTKPVAKEPATVVTSPVAGAYRRSLALSVTKTAEEL